MPPDLVCCLPHRETFVASAPDELKRSPRNQDPTPARATTIAHRKPFPHSGTNRTSTFLELEGTSIAIRCQESAVALTACPSTSARISGYQRKFAMTRPPWDIKVTSRSSPSVRSFNGREVKGAFSVKANGLLSILRTDSSSS